MNVRTALEDSPTFRHAHVLGRVLGVWRDIALRQSLALVLSNSLTELIERGVERYLAANGHMRITREAATRLGLIMPAEFRHLARPQDGPGGSIR